MGRKLTLVISFWGSAFSIRDARGRHLGDRVRRRFQPVDATHALNLSAGVSNPKVLRGRSFS